MASKFVLLILPALALADIYVNLFGKDIGYALNLYTNYGGEDVSVITNTEINSFTLTDNDLKDVIRLHHGKRPDDAFLRSPTPWGDLYKKYEWKEVTRTLKPKNATILHSFSQPTVINQQVFENNSSKPASFDVGISKRLFNTFTSTWSTNGLLSIENEINHNIQIESKSRQMTYFNYSLVWNQNTRWAQPVTVGATSYIKVTLQPGQAVVAYLQVTIENIQMQVEYAASLDGQIVVNYANTYNGDHISVFDIDECMTSATLSNQLMSREVIDIGLYSESRVIVNDRDRGYKLMEVPF